MTGRNTKRPIPGPIGVSGGGRPPVAIRYDDEPLEGLTPRIWLDHYTSYRMHSTTKLISVIAEQLYSDRLGITIIESRVLNLVAVLGPMSTRELSEQSRMNRVTVSRASQSLITRGLLNRMEHETDKRLIRLTLTPAGLLAHQEIVGLLNWFEESVCDAIGIDEVRRIRDDLNRIEAHFQAIYDEVCGDAADGGAISADRGKE